MTFDPPSSPAARRGVAAWIMLALIRVYQLTLSAFMGRTCRYAPTCSEYTADAIRRYGAWAGGWMGLARLQRCRPGGCSGFDPIPEALPADACWSRPWRYGRWGCDHIDPATRLD
ncbi:membrane protein insertion efficiency factor YidD [Stappia sp.]|uniref:membrane protein insertion efficiency factor YidD n=1 Tax=Stappia sp. TaxID=1870903 RepID=UPI0035B53D0B